MKVYWLSWWDDPNGKPGKHLPPADAKRVEYWVTGHKGEIEMQSICARVEAESLEEAWRLVDVMFPGASTDDVRFADELEPGWWPPADRFPRGRAE